MKAKKIKIWNNLPRSLLFLQAALRAPVPGRVCAPPTGAANFSTSPCSSQRSTEVLTSWIRPLAARS